MANKITWADKVALQEKPDVAAENKVTAADMNQIKMSVNETIEKMPSNLKNGIAGSSLRTVGSAEESNSYKLGQNAFAEGGNTKASGRGSHAEGDSTTASGETSHAEGYGTTAKGNYSHAEGKFNIEDTENKCAHIVGNGKYNDRSNAHTLDWSGNAWFAGDIYTGSTSGKNKDDGSVKLAKITELPTKTSQLTNDSDFATNASISGSYLKLAGGTMSGAIQRAGNTCSWNTIRESNTSAGIAFTSYTGYQPVIKQKTPSGVWGVGAYTDAIHFTYFTDSSTDNNPAQLLQLQYSGAIYSSGVGLAHTFVQSSQPTAIQTGDIWFVV